MAVFKIGVAIETFFQCKVHFLQLFFMGGTRYVNPQFLPYFKTPFWLPGNCCIPVSFL